MGTRSLTHIYEENGDEIVVMYRQYDGYPEGHGLELAQFLDGMDVINGIPVGKDIGKSANGMSCLAAQMVAHFKSDIGSIYLHPAGTTDAWQNYDYHIKVEEGNLTVLCNNPGQPPLFKGSTAEFLEFCADPDSYSADSNGSCRTCGKVFKHPLHGRNHYAAHNH